jgi:hypothetical protein
MHCKPDTQRGQFAHLYRQVYSTHDQQRHSVGCDIKQKQAVLPSLRAFLSQVTDAPNGVKMLDGFQRIQRCRTALDALDRRGWKRLVVFLYCRYFIAMYQQWLVMVNIHRSYFQRKFHEQFIRATARIFWKLEGPGQFARDHQKILEVNGWDFIAQEILISTPRRFGKTISVSMFAAAMIFSSAAVEISIYSTCKRISQKLLRNICKFLDLIYLELKCTKLKIIRSNMEEIVLQGPEGDQDIRIVNSYPSKVRSCLCMRAFIVENIYIYIYMYMRACVCALFLHRYSRCKKNPKGDGM